MSHPSHMTPAHSARPEWQRAIIAQPYIYLSIAASIFLTMIGFIERPSPSASGEIEVGDTFVRVLPSFHALPFLDDIFRDTVVDLVPSTFAIDEPSWWQMLVFLNDIGVVHMVWLLEASRGNRVRKWWLSPTLWQVLSLLVPGAVTYPMYYFLLYVFNCPSPGLAPTARRIDVSDAIVYLPAMLAFYSIPVARMFFAPSLEGRHWWTWMWLLFAVRVSLSRYVSSYVQSVLEGANFRARLVSYYFTVLWLVLGPMLFVSFAAWTYTIHLAPFSIHTIFWPTTSESGETSSFVEIIGHVTKFKYWFMLGSTLLWGVYMVWDVKRLGMASTRNTLGILTLLLAVLQIGPASTFGTMWIVRESYLVRGGKTVTKSL